MAGPLIRSFDRSDTEHLPVRVFRDSAAASAQVAAEIAQLIRERQKEGRQAVLGLATGSTPLGVYEELVRLHQHERLSFANVVTFNLDQYWPMDPGDLQSYRRFMRENLFDRVDIDQRHTHVPDGACLADAV
ncbi:MAG TPA: 6-phosphogluconolactonase, partial [Phycisphaerales bacterium]|nr:6-phosphogluconolactonase [Phycisphaerales bacterium]